MANFPTSVFSPAARSNGQVIDASHVNSLQEEVTAIEDGFRNATAPLNSSKSTLASLSVTGGSTLATLNVTGASTFGAMTLGASTLASIQVTGGSTLASLNAGASTLASLSVAGGSTVTTLTVTGGSTFAVRPVMPRVPYCQVTVTADVALSSNGAGAVVAPNWDTEVADDDGLHSTVSNSSRVNLTSAGIWDVSGQVVWRLQNSSGVLVVSLVANDNQVLSVAVDREPLSTATIMVARTLYVATSTTQYVTLQANNATGSTRSLNGSTFWGGTALTVQRVSD